VQETNLNRKQYVSITYHIKARDGAYTKPEEYIMPVQRVTVKGETFYRWGTMGKLYKKREDAERQGMAAYSAGYAKKKKKGYGK